MRRLFGVIFTVLFFLTPSAVLVVGGFHGFYMVYIVLGVLLALSIPIAAVYRGWGALDIYSSLTLALSIVFIYFVLGFIFGFGARPRVAPLSLLTSLGLFLVNLLVVEVARGIAVNLSRGVWRIAIGVAVGLLFGDTIPAMASYIGGFFSSPLPFIRDVLYSYTVTLIHIYGGFVSAVVFRVVVDGFLRFSPLVPDVARFVFIWSAISILVYYGAIVYLYHSIPRVAGYSREVFKMRRITRYIDIAINAAVYSISILLILSAYLRIIPMTVVSGSMAPTLSVGDIVLIDAKKPLNTSIGDIVAFKFDNTIVVHRVVEAVEGGFRTKGDANPDLDPFIVTRDMIIGRVVGNIPRLGLFTILLQQGFEVLQIGLAPSLLLAILIAVVIPAILLLRRKFIPRF